MPWEDDLGGGNNGGGTNPDDNQGQQEELIGKTLPALSEGCLDIHLINSGRGECNFYILPDGTTLLIDAGELPLTYGD